VQGLRELDLRKNPGISETIDWAKALVALQAETLDRRTLERTLSVLLKHEQDLQRARRRLAARAERDAPDQST
ncbi:MAG: MoxR family ATPase, partial [Anaerolineaceae bacterium]|nr:MoxR family ATPase [Anaerolineaceae bacterium]